MCLISKLESKQLPESLSWPRDCTNRSTMLEMLLLSACFWLDNSVVGCIFVACTVLLKLMTYSLCQLLGKRFSISNFGLLAICNSQQKRKVRDASARLACSWLTEFSGPHAATKVNLSSTHTDVPVAYEQGKRHFRASRIENVWHPLSPLKAWRWLAQGIFGACVATPDDAVWHTRDAALTDSDEDHDDDFKRWISPSPYYGTFMDFCFLFAAI